MSSSRSRRFVQGGVGILISAVCLVVVLQGVDVGRTASVLSGASPLWVLVALVALAGDVVFRGVRWQILVAPIKHVAYPRLLAYMLVGYLGNNVLPARLGELVRSHYLGDREGISRTTTLGTVVVERVIDTVVLVAIAAVAILVLQVRGVVANAVLAGLAVAGLLLLALAVAVAAHRLPGYDLVVELVARWPRLRELIRKLREGLAVAARPRTVAEAVFMSCLAWGCTVLGFAAAGQAVGIQLTTGEAALLAAGVNLATAIPSGPGYLGTFELAAVKIAAAFAIPADPALALAILVHAGTLVMTSVGGAIVLARMGWRRPEAEEADTETARPASPAGLETPAAATPASAEAPRRSGVEPT